MKKNILNIMKTRNIKINRKIDGEKTLRLIINSMLKTAGWNFDYDYIVKNQYINGQPWYLAFYFENKELWEKWKKRSIQKLKRIYPEYTDDMINTMFHNIDLQYGLRVKNNE